MLCSLSISGGMTVWMFLDKLLRDESGATAIEYGLIAALISVVIIAAVTAVGTQLSGVFNSIATGLGTASLRQTECRPGHRPARLRSEGRPVQRGRLFCFWADAPGQKMGLPRGTPSSRLREETPVTEPSRHAATGPTPRARS